MTIPTFNLRNSLLNAALLTAVSSLPVAHAATQTYTDASASNVWDATTLNWDASSAFWTNNNDAVFGGTGESVELNAAVSANSLTFNSENYSLVDASADGALTLTGTKTITTNAVTTTISDVLLGTVGLTKAGTGTLILNGANTYTGVTTVSDGTLQVNANSGGKLYTLASTGTLQLAYGIGNGYGYGVTVNGAGTAATTGLYVKGGISVSLAETLLLQGAPTTVRAYGTGPAVLAGWDTNKTYLSVVAAASGSVTDANVNFAPSTYGYTMNIAAGANTATGDITFLGQLTGAPGANSAHFRKSGAGSLALAGASTNTAAVDIRAGSVILTGGANRIGTGAPVYLGNGTTSGKLILNGNDQALANLYSVGTGTTNAVVNGSATSVKLTVNYTGAGQTFAGTLGGAGANENNFSFVKGGTGTYTLTGTNTYTGGTTVTGGILGLGSAGAVGSTGLITLAGGGIQFSAASATDLTAGGRLKLDDGGTGTIDTNGTDVVFTSPFVLGTLGSSGLGKSGAGTLTLAAAESFTGGTTVSAGVLALDYGSANSSKLSDTAALTLAGGTLRLVGGSHAETVLSTLVTGASVIERSGGTATINLGEITRSGVATLSIAGNGIARTTLTNDVSGKLPSWITVAGQPAANDGSGNIISYSGFVDVARLGGKIPNNPLANLRIVNGGTSGTVTPQSTGLTDIATLLQNATAGPATVTLGGSDTLRLGAGGAVIVPATSGALTFTGGTLTAGGADETDGEIAISAEAPVTIASMILDNGIEGAVTLNKTGGSSLTLAETAAHSGGTVLNAGELRVNHFQGLGIGSLTVNGGSLNNTSGDAITVEDNIDQTWNANIDFIGTNNLLFSSGTTTLAADRTVTVQGGEFGVGALAGAFALNKTGPGKFIVGGGTWTGTTTITEGTLEVTGRAVDAPYTVTPTGTLMLAYTTGGGYALSNIKLNGSGTAATTGLYLKGGSSYNAAGTIQLLGAPTTIRHYGTGLASLGMFDINADGLTTVAAASGSVIDANIEIISRGYGMSVNIASGAATATGDLVINGPLNAGSLGLYKRGAGSLALNAAATTSNLGIKLQGGSIITGIANALGENAEMPISAGAKLIMNGHSQAAATLSGAGQVVNASAAPAALTIKQLSDQTFSGTLGGTTADEKNFSFAKTGTFKLTLSGPNTYTGSTTVAAGTLSLTTPFLADGSDVILDSAEAILDLGTGATDTIDELIVDGSAVSPGIYGAIGSLAQHEVAYITGTGKLEVTTGGEAGDYDEWETTYNITGAGADTDSDGDGIPNGIEFVIGGIPFGMNSNSTALLPTISTDATYVNFVFRRSDDSASYDPAAEYSTSLGGWITAEPGEPTLTPVIVNEENNFYGGGIDKVTVRIPRALAGPGGKLFARLAVEIP